MVGVNKLLFTPTENVVNAEEEQEASEDEGPISNKKFSRGLTLLDAAAITEVLPTVHKSAL